MSVTTLAVFERLWPYFHIERYVKDGGNYENARWRIEMRRMPPALAREAVTVQMPCVVCGDPIFPFRARNNSIRQIYFACSCALDRKWCSRNTKKTHIEYEAVRAAVEGRSG